MMAGAYSSRAAMHVYHNTWHRTAQDNLRGLQILHITDALVCDVTTDWSNTDICTTLELSEDNGHITVNSK
jgi:hypothetical protein